MEDNRIKTYFSNENFQFILFFMIMPVHNKYLIRLSGTYRTCSLTDFHLSKHIISYRSNCRF